MKRIILMLLLAAVCNGAIAENIALRCVGSATEQIMGHDKILNTVTVQIERFYEFSQDEVVEHVGTLVFTHKRAEVGRKEKTDSHSHDGYYRLEPLFIAFDENTMTKFDEKNVDLNMRHFEIDRQTAKWKVWETYRGGFLVLYNDINNGLQVVKNVSVNGSCEPWNAKAKF